VAVSGAALQGLFRNPLADPVLIGVSSGAALAAATAIVMGAAMMLWPVAGFWAGWLPP
jgi:iron complex transport system permease protein